MLVSYRKIKKTKNLTATQMKGAGWLSLPQKPKITSLRDVTNIRALAEDRLVNSFWFCIRPPNLFIKLHRYSMSQLGT